MKVLNEMRTEYNLDKDIYTNEKILDALNKNNGEKLDALIDLNIEI